MNDMLAAYTLKEQNKIYRLLKFLLKAPAIREYSADHGLCLLTSVVWGTIAIDSVLLEKLLQCNAVEMISDDFAITDRGNQILKPLKNSILKSSAARVSAEQYELCKAHINTGGVMQSVLVNIAESPLAMLYHMNKMTGKRFLSEEEFLAGERLRADFTRGNMLPQISVNWENISARRRRGKPGGAADLSDHALDCRARVDKALLEVGPELSGVLLDICCFLKGLEVVERERSWPVRSAKMLLKTALSILHRHYYANQMPAANIASKRFHWGDKDYRPSL